MATQALAQPRYIGTRNQDVSRRFAGGPEAPEIKEAASQTYGLGALVYLVSGLVTIATATTQLAGQALQAATGTTNQSAYLAVIRAGDRFVMNVYHTTQASAITAQAQLGTVYGLVVVAGQFHADIENVATAEDATHSSGRVKVVGFYKEDAIGDIYGRVVVEFEEWSLASDGNPNQRILQLA
jgi:hypothetical protein